MRTLVLALALVGFGACELPPREGRVIDRETSAPVAGAQVIELWQAGRALSDVAATRHVRRSTTDAEGRFILGAERSMRTTQAARTPGYVIAHPSYGVVRFGEPRAADSTLEFAISRDDVAARNALAALCESPPREDWERDLAASLCRSPRGT